MTGLLQNGERPKWLNYIPVVPIVFVIGSGLIGLGSWFMASNDQAKRLTALEQAITNRDITQSARDTAQEAASIARDKAQDDRIALDHERLVLLDPRISQNTGAINQINTIIDRWSQERTAIREAIMLRIDNVEKGMDAKVASLRDDQQEMGERMATLIERLSSISGQLESLNQLVRDRFPDPSGRGSH